MLIYENFYIQEYNYYIHEHLPEFGLINMNGRMYDPALGRMLSPDNYVQSPGNAQNYNRYSYCLNNPLKYTDPSGNSAVLTAAIVGAYMYTTINGMTGKINSNKDFYFSMAIGAASGASGVGAGQFAGGFAGTIGFLGGSLTGAAGGFAGGFVSGFGSACMDGTDLLSGGLRSGVFGAITGGIIGGVSGGIHAKVTGREFFSGSYKQYDLEYNLLASSNDIFAEFTYDFPDDAIIANADDYNVYYRAENGVAGIKDYVEPGKYIKAPKVDGVATSWSANKVYKIPDGGRVYVGNGGFVVLKLSKTAQFKLSLLQTYIIRIINMDGLRIVILLI